MNITKVEKAIRRLELGVAGGWRENKRADDCPLVEIITCKDCKYYREDDDTGHCTNHTCEDITFWCHDDYYCADAERRE